MTRLGLMVLTAGLCASCLGQPANPAKVPTKPEPSVKCRIRADGNKLPMNVQRVSKGKAAILHVVLENLSSDPVEIKGTVVYLGNGRPPSAFSAPGEPEFDALVDIEKKSALEISVDSHGVLKYPEQRLTFAPHQSLAFDLDIANLKWERMSSSSYSAISLWATVPPGSYSEYVSITGRDAIGRFDVESNKITLEVLP